MVGTTPFVVGLTGGVGSGKSTVADWFSAQGCRVVDADVISRKFTGPGGSAMLAIETAFGQPAVKADGALNRSWMREQAFADSGIRAKLEAILHPMIRAAIAKELSDVDSEQAPLVVLVVPLLFESPHYLARVMRCLVVDCPEALQVERVARREGLTESMALSITKAQLPRQIRLQLATDIIENNGSLETLYAQTARLDAKFRALAECTGRTAK